MGNDVSCDGDYTGLAALTIEPRTLLTKQLSSGSFSTVFRFDVVARITVRVIVMHGLSDRVPRTCWGHRGNCSFGVLCPERAWRVIGYCPRCASAGDAWPLAVWPFAPPWQKWGSGVASERGERHAPEQPWQPPLHYRSLRGVADKFFVVRYAFQAVTLCASLCHCMSCIVKIQLRRRIL
jgi:hypothetical protein